MGENCPSLCFFMRVTAGYDLSHATRGFHTRHGHHQVGHPQEAPCNPLPASASEPLHSRGTGVHTVFHTVQTVHMCMYVHVYVCMCMYMHVGMQVCG